MKSRVTIVALLRAQHLHRLPAPGSRVGRIRQSGNPYSTCPVWGKK